MSSFSDLRSFNAAPTSAAVAMKVVTTYLSFVGRPSPPVLLEAISSSPNASFSFSSLTGRLSRFSFFITPVKSLSWVSLLDLMPFMYEIIVSASRSSLDLLLVVDGGEDVTY